MVKKTMDDPLDNLPTFDPELLETADESQNRIATHPVSPLDPASIWDGESASTAPSSVTLLLEEANRHIDKLQAELDAERVRRRELEKRNYELEAVVNLANQSEAELERGRQSQLQLERQIAAMEVKVKDSEGLLAQLEQERAARLELERKTATLEVLSEKARELADLLAEERGARVDLEREKATLDVEVKHAQKLETFLAEERRARMNAQSRAASAEAKLSRLEGELAQMESTGTSTSFFKRLRGR
jgi:DNA repair exonuclease SbcCD ATPase subunit